MPSKTSESFGISQSICTRTLRNLTRYLHRNPPEPHQASSPPKPSRTPQGRNPPEPHHASSPRPSGTSSGSCTGNLRNLTRYLHQNPLEPNHVSSGTSQGTCTGNFRNLTRYLHRNPPEPHRTLWSLSRYLHRNPPEPHEVSAPETLRNLVRNLVLKLQRIAPELIWAKDPIAKFCCWGKTRGCVFADNISMQVRNILLFCAGKRPKKGLLLSIISFIGFASISFSECREYTEINSGAIPNSLKASAFLP